MTTTNLPTISPFVNDDNTHAPHIIMIPMYPPPLKSMEKVRAAPPEFNGNM
jgi:hypothetical protein